MLNTGNIILDKSFSYALDIIKYTEVLEENKKFVIANQLKKSGTSIGANVHEAQNAESRADFIHKQRKPKKQNIGFYSANTLTIIPFRKSS